MDEEREIIDRYSFHVDSQPEVTFSRGGFGATARIQTSYRLLFNTKVHKRVEAVLGVDCEQALYSNLALADAYADVHMTSLALDHALTGLHNAEDMFGSFSEVTVQGYESRSVFACLVCLFACICVCEWQHVCHRGMNIGGSVSPSVLRCIAVYTTSPRPKWTRALSHYILVREGSSI
jgi:hypothetical protein